MSVEAGLVNGSLFNHHSFGEVRVPGPMLRKQASSAPPGALENVFPAHLPQEQSVLFLELRNLLGDLERRLAQRIDDVAEMHGIRHDGPALPHQKKKKGVGCSLASEAPRCNAGLPVPRSVGLPEGLHSSPPASCSLEALAPAEHCHAQASPEQAAKETLDSGYTRQDLLERKKATSKHHAARVMVKTDRRPSKLEVFVMSPGFEAAFAGLVLVSSFFVGWEVQNASYNRSRTRPVGWFVTDCVFTSVFLLELTLRACALKCSVFRRKHIVWFFLDGFLVLSSLFGVCIEMVVMLKVAEVSDIGGLSQLRLIRILRITRTLRTLQTARLIRFVASLRTLVASIVGTVQSLLWACLLLILMNYTVAIVFAEAVNARLADGSDPLLEKYWGSLAIAMFTLFESISGGISWHEVVDPFYDLSVGLVALFAAYIFVTTFAVLNVLTGVFCQSAIDKVGRDPDLATLSILDKRKNYLKQLHALFDTLDDQKSGEIRLPDFERLLSDPTMQAHLAAMGVEAQDAWSMFKLVDVDGNQGVDREEFVAGMMRLQGQARALDVASVMEVQRWLNRILTKMAQNGVAEHEHPK